MRMMLIAASWPSNRLPAVTNRHVRVLGHQRQRSPLAEHQQHEQLVPCEGELEVPQLLVDAPQQQLLRPHDRGHGRHARGRIGPPLGLPPTARLGDRIERQGGLRHEHPLCIDGRASPRQGR
jgi:hypothetical protein